MPKNESPTVSPDSPVPAPAPPPGPPARRLTGDKLTHEEMLHLERALHAKDKMSMAVTLARMTMNEAQRLAEQSIDDYYRIVEGLGIDPSQTFEVSPEGVITYHPTKPPAKEKSQK